LDIPSQLTQSDPKQEPRPRKCVIRQVMSAARAQNAAISGKIVLQMEVEIGP
jgi:hypothetical protein